MAFDSSYRGGDRDNQTSHRQFWRQNRSVDHAPRGTEEGIRLEMPRTHSSTRRILAVFVSLVTRSKKVPMPKAIELRWTLMVKTGTTCHHYRPVRIVSKVRS